MSNVGRVVAVAGTSADNAATDPGDAVLLRRVDDKRKQDAAVVLTALRREQGVQAPHALRMARPPSARSKTKLAAA
jgi:hypothetical protein